MESVEAIRRVMDKIAPGLTPSFSEVHAIKALEILGARAIGRIRLSRELGLSEATTRTLLRHLKNKKLIEISRSGISLSKFGKKILLELRSKMSESVEVQENSLTVGAFNVAILIKKAAEAVRFGLEQRDDSIKAGALGATTLVFINHKLSMPGVNDYVFNEMEPIQNELMTKLKPEENDVIIIGSANDKRSAEFGAKTAAFELVK